jgi:hypothetical protein
MARWGGLSSTGPQAGNAMDAAMIEELEISVD